jgi:hypothetical protein
MRRISTLIVLLAALIAPASAAAAQSPVVADCVEHGQLTQTYTLGQLRTGLSTMSADVKEYTNCFDVIQRALNQQLAGVTPKTTTTGSGSGSGGSFLPTPVIVILVLLALAVVTFVAISLRRRGNMNSGNGDDRSPTGGPPGDR